MTASILGIGTAVPATRLQQDDVRDLLAAQPGLDRRARRLLTAAFGAAAIDTRYTVLGELGGGIPSGLSLSDGSPVLPAACPGRGTMRTGPAMRNWSCEPCSHHASSALGVAASWDILGVRTSVVVRIRGRCRQPSG